MFAGFLINIINVVIVSKKLNCELISKNPVMIKNQGNV